MMFMDQAGWHKSRALVIPDNMEYKDGTRTPRPFANAREMFSAMDLEDKMDDGE